MREDYKEDYRTRFAKESEKQTKKTKKHHTGLYRFLAAVMLFSILMFAFQNHISVCGINEAKIEKLMSSDSHWSMLVEKTNHLYKKVVVSLREEK